jgi:hypothetical protein
MVRIVRLVAGTFLVGLSGLCWLAFYDRYWRWRDCFNELGRCYDEVSQDVYLEQAGVVWSSLAVGCIVLAIVLLGRASRR